MITTSLKKLYRRRTAPAIFSSAILLTAVLLLASLASCGTRNTGGSSEEFDQPTYLPAHASGFRILGAEGHESVILESFDPWQGADSMTTRLFIARGGESAPDGFDGPVLNGEAKRIVAMSSTHIAMLDAFGETDRVKGVSGIDFISNPTIQSRRDSIGDVGYEGNIDYELLLALDPDIVLLFSTNGASRMEGKLDELGIPYAYIGDYLESSPLGKAEWLVAIGEIAGCRAEAEKVFADIPSRYEALKQLVAGAESSAPKVMVNAPYGDSWFMPSTESYVVRLIEDAGGNYLYARNTGNTSLPIDIEEAYRLASEADVWINTGTMKSLDELRAICPKFTDTKPFTTGNVFNNNARTGKGGGNDYFESAVVKPDIVLRDLIGIFHPEVLSDSCLVYYHRLK